MDLFPAIDIRNGRVVRLEQGEPERQTIYQDDPLGVAEDFIAQGTRWIHLVDLDRALGVGSNLEVIRRVVQRVSDRIQVQVGGGLRDLELVRSVLEIGASRVVVGTAAAMQADLIPAAVEAFGAESLAVAVDARDGFVAIRGWTELSPLRPAELASQVVAQGIGTLVYTNIQRDGMLSGPDLFGAMALQRTGARVIASGGVASPAHIADACKAGLSGIIVGRALYEGHFSLREGLRAASCAPAR
ncbi:MAG TPA: 1-(5-phosphoribosyl)-5-[(5-phosphoribosylamino)methylideneamino]imidazole-4-carboxamide isomerase [Gemmatimonadales bacterium]|nr:1-(5-phosphoribosyl)-5-[(5-phosphoribosylamino)methylideneamino]imidazole-4-carboxamide isomerase [Gemmatimonadales bacterium]